MWADEEFTVCLRQKYELTEYGSSAEGESMLLCWDGVARVLSSWSSSERTNQ